MSSTRRIVIELETEEHLSAQEVINLLTYVLPTDSELEVESGDTLKYVVVNSINVLDVG